MALAIIFSPAAEAAENFRPIPAASAGGAEIGEQPLVMETEAVTAWTSLQAADAEIPALIARGRFADISERSELIKAAATAIGQGLRASDKSTKRRLDSVVRQVIGFADQLRDAAASGKSNRITAAYQNLHRYVEWGQAHLPRVSAGSAAAGPVAG